MTVYAAGHALASGLITTQDEVVVSEKAWKMGGSRMFIEVNTRVTVEQLLDGIIVQSGNDASVALAEHISGTEEMFASVMNEHAERLGMHDSHFSNATGWPDPETYTTARDLALLAAALIRSFRTSMPASHSRNTPTTASVSPTAIACSIATSRSMASRRATPRRPVTVC